MADYKVPQDVEADDKLIGPFSFRQFVYILIVVASGFVAWGLAQLFIGLVVLPLPIMIFFGTLALPLRKDQPMEVYMAAIVSFYLKPRRRMWEADGIDTFIEITAPKTVEQRRTKDLSQDEAGQRLSYLASLVDSQGWSIRGVSGAGSTAVNNDIYLEAQGAEDILDTNTTRANNFDAMMSKSAQQVRDEARAHMMQPAPTPPPPPPPPPAMPSQATLPPQPQAPPPPTPDPTPAVATPQAQPDPAVIPHYNPYPEFHQAVIQPTNGQHQAERVVDAVQAVAADESAKADTPSTSDDTPSAGIMNLANNPDLSIETIAHEAQRLKHKAELEDEVVISLR